MKIIAILFVISGISAVSASALDVTCNFVYQASIGVYACEIVKQSIPDDENLKLNFVGEHLHGKNNGDVERIYIIDSDIPFVSPQFFTTFPRVNMFSVDNGLSRIDSFSFSNGTELSHLLISNNENLRELVGHTFTGARELITIDLSNNQIEIIDDEAFNGAFNLRSLVLDGNRIQKILPRTFTTLTSLHFLSLNRNQVEFLDGRLFMNNTGLNDFYVNDNKINAIGSEIFDGISKLRFFAAERNVCVNKAWLITGSVTINTVRQELQTCFKNAQENEVKQYISGFRGQIVGRQEIKMENEV